MNLAAVILSHNCKAFFDYYVIILGWVRVAVNFNPGVGIILNSTCKHRLCKFNTCPSVIPLFLSQSLSPRCSLKGRVIRSTGAVFVGSFQCFYTQKNSNPGPKCTDITGLEVKLMCKCALFS